MGHEHCRKQTGMQNFHGSLLFSSMGSWGVSKYADDVISHGRAEKYHTVPVNLLMMCTSLISQLSRLFSFSFHNSLGTP